MGREVTLRLFGDFAAEVDGGAPVRAGDFERRTGAELVQLLAITDGHTLHRDQVLDAIWPEAGIDRAKNAFYKAATFARRALDDEAITVRDGMVILFADWTISVDTDIVAAADPDEPASIDAALDVWRAPLLPTVPYADWALRGQDRLRRDLISALTVAGRWHELFELDPTDEVAAVEVMEHAVRSSDPAAALRHFRRLDEALRDELGVSAGPRSLAARDAAVEAVESPTTTAVAGSLARRAGHVVPSLHTTLLGRDRSATPGERLRHRLRPRCDRWSDGAGPRPTCRSCRRLDPSGRVTRSGADGRARSQRRRCNPRPTRWGRLMAERPASPTTTVTSMELAADFVEQGYVVVPDLVDSAVRQAIIDDGERFRSGHHPVTNLPASGDILAVHFPHYVSEVAADAVRHPGVVEVVSQIAGAHLPKWDGATKCMQSMLFFKPPGLQGQAWHQDERFIPTRDRSLVGAWIALDDADTDNGCLWVLPGSHRTGQLWPTRQHGRPDEFDPTDESFGFDESGAIPVEVEAGAVVFFNGYLLHRSLRNRSQRTRMALVNHYMNAWSPLPWMVSQGIDVGTHNVRTVVQTSGDDPYAWDPIVDPPATTFVRPASGRFEIGGATSIDLGADGG